MSSAFCRCGPSIIQMAEGASVAGKDEVEMEVEGA